MQITLLDHYNYISDCTVIFIQLRCNYVGSVKFSHIFFASAEAVKKICHFTDYSMNLCTWIFNFFLHLWGLAPKIICILLTIERICGLLVFHFNIFLHNYYQISAFFFYFVMVLSRHFFLSCLLSLFFAFNLILFYPNLTVGTPSTRFFLFRWIVCFVC